MTFIYNLIQIQNNKIELQKIYTFLLVKVLVHTSNINITIPSLGARFGKLKGKI